MEPDDTTARRKSSDAGGGVLSFRDTLRRSNVLSVTNPLLQQRHSRSANAASQPNIAEQSRRREMEKLKKGSKSSHQPQKHLLQEPSASPSTGSRPVLWGDPMQRQLKEQQWLLTRSAGSTVSGGSHSDLTEDKSSFHASAPSSRRDGGGLLEAAQHDYVTMLFTSSVEAARGTEKDAVKQFLTLMRSAVPRVRLEASTVTRSSSSSDGSSPVFEVPIQVVPMHSLLQVSRGLVTNWPRVHLIAKSKPFVVILLLSYLALLLSMLIWMGISGAQKESSTTQRALTVLVLFCLSLAIGTTSVLMTQFSLPLLILVSRTYDFWLLVFWIVVSTLCSLQHNENISGAPKLASRIGAFSIALSQVAVLLLDALPGLPRHLKGAIYVVNAAFNAYRYLSWYILARGNDTTAAAVVDLGTFNLHLATAGQASGGALLAFNLRLAVRSLLKKLDLALVDFAVNSVPSGLQHDGEDNAGRIDDDHEANGEEERGHDDVEEGNTRSPSADMLEQRRRFSPRGAEKQLQLASFSSSGKDVRSFSGLSSPSHHLVPMSIVNISGSFPVSERDLVSKTAELQRLFAAHFVKICFFPHLEVTMFDSDRRTFLPRSHMLTFAPTPLIASTRVFLGLSSVWWPRIVVCCVTFGAVLMLLVDVIDKGNYIGMAAVQSFLFTIAVTQLLFGISVDMVRHVVLTLDFWYVMAVFASQVVAKGYVYAHSYNTSLAVVHILMVSSTAVFVATIDCISIPSFDRTIKGICGLVLGLYCILDLLFTTPAAIRAKKELYSKNVDVWIFLLSPGSMAQLASFACFLLFVRMTARTLWMRSTLVFLQIGAVEETAAEEDEP
jgi:hypothetical protein